MGASMGVFNNLTIDESQQEIALHMEIEGNQLNRLRNKLLSWMDQSCNSAKTTAPILRVNYKKLTAFIEDPSRFVNDYDFRQAIDHFLDRPEYFWNIPKSRISKTSVFNDLWQAWQYCRKYSKMGAVFAPSGVGKTIFANECKRQHPNTILMGAHIVRKSMSEILSIISRSLGCGSYGTSPSHVYIDKIVEFLQEWPRPLIIDEAHFLGWNALEAIRTIHDAVPFPVLYLGQPRLYDEMRGKKNRYLYDQILSRLSIRRSVGDVILKEDVRLVAESLYPGINNQCVGFLHKKAQGEGKLRTMSEGLQLAIIMAKTENRPLDLSILKAANYFLMS